MSTKSYKVPEPTMRETLAIMREIQAAEKETANYKKQRPVTAISMLMEDFSNSNNQDFQEEQQAILAALNASVVITNRDDNGERVELSGTIKFNSEAKFIFTTERNDGVYISTDTLQLDEEVLQSIMKLRAYYEQWYQKNIQRDGNVEPISGDGNPLNMSR